MSRPIQIHQFDIHENHWPSAVDEIRTQLGAPDNSALLPSHFLKVVLPKLGGGALRIENEGILIGYAFLFPLLHNDGEPVYTLRYHTVPGLPTIKKPLLLSAIEKQTGMICVFYDPSHSQQYSSSYEIIDQLSFGHPSNVEVEQIRALQQRIWNSEPDLLYPADIHSNSFGLGTSLVARSRDEVVAFLFGFLKFGGSTIPSLWHAQINTRIRLESQVMGVSPEYRGRRIAYTLKQLQARQAIAHNIDIINWTTDPLQFPNAALNFSCLHAVAYEFVPNLYEFHNDLNRQSPLTC